MSHISLHTSSDNPVNRAELEKTLSSFGSEGLTLKPDDVEDYTRILAGAHEVFQKIINLPDYVPVVDKRFSRQNVHAPTPAENEHNAWAWKVSVKDDSPSGPLKGLTVCLKDNIALADVPCSVGTSYIEDWVPNTDATVVTRVLEAGGEITGKAVCENLSFFGASISSGTGRMDNVYAKGYSAGGSSSGCGVLVARGDCDMAIGGDQGGSIRLPAAHNGIVGMKPTHGLVPYTGICLLERTIDTTGPMTKDVLSNALLLKVLAGSDSVDDRQLAGCPSPSQVPDYPALAKQPIKGLRIGIVAESLDTDLTDKRYANFVVDAAKRFLELGAEVVEPVSIPGTVLASDLWMVIARLSSYQNLTGRACGHRGLYLNDFTQKFLPITQQKLDQMWPSAVATLTNGAYAWENLDPTLMGKTMNLARKVRDEIDAVLGSYDLLITPTMVKLPARINNVPENATPLQKMSYAAGVGLNTCPYSLTGHPAMSIPVGFLSPVDDPTVRLPVGMQIVGKFYDEATIYRAAYTWESSCDWKERLYSVVGAMAVGQV
ncbi:hypothetical protein I302_105120 [Kwoniella bestiolae CBS 10118]|uniref:Amidase domain-containing protein n=1 Tax=Kwoniella bestiolae CBS 10118 TaxID=1296100 RepID=A0A1B9FS91_9TREE|nr:hypothetical protein I302_08407 [Kwoniella bestiolae CBS 10118]OCF21632.1 hypothetical protein I302_08407 [Kwoniella bestiolae CBS 10118]